MKDDARTLAKADVQEGVISAEQYEQYIGEPYPVETDTAADTEVNV